MTARGVVARCFVLGVATGGRGSMGLAAPLLAGPPPEPGSAQRVRVRRWVLLLGVVGEMVIDKLPTTPSRLNAPGPALRVANAVAGAAILARRAGSPLPLPALAGAAGALAGTWTGAAWRGWADARGPDWPGALLEDAASVGLAALAVRSR
ncbi:hypothetical protein [Cellulomonas timonensis]|uniref:hypothetical protein n=1 Tax=Cellulomonas timonensis TaxID=1689271 RepID=UPI0008312112|nr:hypothetical protein [Cellulomonas timonensis]